MRPVALVLLLFSTGVCLAQEEVTFAYAPLKAGDRRTSEHETRTEMRMELSQNENVQSLEMSEREVRRTVLTVLEDDGSLPTRLRITCIEATQTKARGKAPGRVERAPQNGRTYEALFAPDGSLTVTSGGDPVEGPAKPRIEKLAESTRKRSSMQEFFAGKTLRVGEPIEVEGEAATALMNMKPGSTVERCTFSLKGVSEARGFACAVLEMTARLGFQEDGLTMAFELQGECEIGLETLRPVKLSLSGPIDIGGAMKGMSITGDGEMHISKLATFERIAPAGAAR